MGVTVNTRAAVPVAAQLTRTGGADGLARSVALLPVSDVTGLEHLATAFAPAAIAQLVGDFASREVATLGPLLEAAGVRDPVSQQVRVPSGLMADPLGRFLSSARPSARAADGRTPPASGHC